MIRIRERRLFLEFYLNHISKNIKRFGNSKIVIYKNTKIKIDKTAQIILKANLFLGLEQREGSIGMSVFKLLSNSRLDIEGLTILYSGAALLLLDKSKCILKGTHIYGNALIKCANYIELGNNTHIANGCYLCDSNFHKIIKNGTKNIVSLPIIISDNVWIAVNSTILSGTNIYANSVIGANSFIYHKTINENELFYTNKDGNTKKIDEWQF